MFMQYNHVGSSTRVMIASQHALRRVTVSLSCLSQLQSSEE